MWSKIVKWYSEVYFWFILANRDISGSSEDCESDSCIQISNYRPVSVRPCFSKILERIMHNRLYSYLVNEKILYSKQFGFQKGHSTDYAIAQLADKFINHLKRQLDTSSFFLIYQRPLTLLVMQYCWNSLKIMELREQILPISEVIWQTGNTIQITNDNKSDLRNTTSGVQQGLHSWTSAFSSLCQWSSIFFQDIKSYYACRRHNLFYEHKNIIKRFATVNEELMNINDLWQISSLWMLGKRNIHYSINLAG